MAARFALGRLIRLFGVLMLVAGLVSVTPGRAAAAAPGSPPSSLSPSSGSTVNTNPVLSWGGVSGATKYRVQVSQDPNFGSTIFNLDTPSLSATPLNDLPLGALYWRVAGMDASSNLGPWANSSFTKAWGVAPTPQVPADGATLTFPTDALLFQWSALAGAASYELQVDDAADFIGAASYTTKNPSYVITEPKTSGQTFYWRVRGVSSTNAVLSNWSTTFHATVVWPGVPTLNYPANGASIDVHAGDVYFDWSAVAGAETYELQVSPDNAFNAKPIDVTVKGTRYAPGLKPLNNASYYWRVRALDAANTPDYSSWSSVNVFSLGWNTRPSLLTPTDGNFAVVTPTFSWTPVDHASWYELEVSPDPNFGSGNQDCFTNRTMYTPYSNTVLGVNVVSPPEGCAVFNFLPGTTYYWHVRAINAPILNPGVIDTNGVVGLWSNLSNSDTFQFQYLPAMPPPDGTRAGCAANGATVTVPTICWHDVQGAVRYKVTVINKNGGPGSTTVSSTDTYSTSWTPVDALPAADSPYIWYVQSYDLNSRLSAIPGSPWTFTISSTAPTTYDTPEQLGPANGSGSLDMPSLSWEPVTGATGYTIWYQSAGALVYNKLNASPTENTAYTFPGNVLPPDTYNWYVQANTGAVSTADHSFVITPLDLVPPSSYRAPTRCATPPNCDPFTDTQTLTWDPVPGAFGYTVYVAQDARFTNIYRTYTTTYPTLSPRDSWLDNQANEAYYWFVRPNRSGNTGRYDETAVLENASSYAKRSNPVATTGVFSPVSGLADCSGTGGVCNEVTFQWTDFLTTNSPAAKQEAKQYHIQVSTVQDFASLIDEKTVDETFFTEYDRTYPEGPIYWRVQAVDGSGNFLTWSTGPLSLQKSSGTVALSSPGAAATVTGVPSFVWQAKYFAATYDIQIAKNGDTNFATANLVTTSNTKMSAFAYTDVLAAGDYAWHVRAVDADGRPGQWSTTRVFHLVPNAPSLTSPSNGAGIGLTSVPSLLLQWSSSQAYPKYQVEVSTSPAFSSTIENKQTVMTSWAPAVSYGVGTYYWHVKALNSANTTVAVSNDWSFTISTIATVGSTYTAITPTRLLDSRDGTGGISTPFTNHKSRSFQVSGRAGIPSNATAVTGNLTVTGQTSKGYLFIGPSQTDNPTSSTLNFPVADDRANGVTVALGAGGMLWVTFVAPSTGPTAQAIFDVTGYFTPDSSGATYIPLNPTRLLDTRDGTGGVSSLGNHASRSFQVAGRANVPVGAIAVTGNLTVTGQTSNGYLFIGPSQTDNPTSSTLNFPLADDRANGVTVALGSSGELWVTFVAPRNGPTADAIFDVTGYFVAGSSGAMYHALSPTRLLDSRDGTGGISTPFTNHASRSFQVTGRGGVPGGANGVTGNLTVTAQGSKGYLFVGPNQTDNPTSSTLNFPVADDRANGVTVALSSGGVLWVTFVAPYNGPSTQAIFDVTGYFGN